MERKKYLYQADYPESIALEKIWFTDRKATKQANYCAQRACTFALFLTFRNNNYYDSKTFVVIFSLILCPYVFILRNFFTTLTNVENLTVLRQLVYSCADRQSPYLPSISNRNHQF